MGVISFDNAGGAAAGRPDAARPRSYSVAAWLCGVAGIALTVWALFLRPVHPLDLDVFLAGGRAVARGHTPYPPLGTPQVWSGSAFVYPWLTAWLFAPIGAFSSHLASLIMAAASAAAIAGGVWSLVGARLAPFAAVLLASPTIDGLQMGTLNAVLFLGVCLAWRWREHPRRVGITIGVLIMLKILCWPLAAWLVVTRRWRATGWSVGVGTALLGLGWIFGPIGAPSYGRLLSQLSAHEAPMSSGLQGMLVRWTVPVAAAELIGIACAGALVMIVARRGDALTYGATVVAVLVASPVVWQHYYLLTAAPLLLVRNGAWWYLLIGWASTAARVSYGISWQWLSVAANIAVVVMVVRVVRRRHRELKASFRRAIPQWVTGSVALLAVALALLAAIGDETLTRGFAPAALPVGACFAAILVSCLRPLPCSDRVPRDSVETTRGAPDAANRGRAGSPPARVRGRRLSGSRRAG